MHGEAMAGRDDSESPLVACIRMRSLREPMVAAAAATVSSRGAASERSPAAELKDVLVAHQNASTKRALWQLANTFLPYFLLWFAMYWALQVSLWLTVPLAILSGALLVRIFIIFHDCTHGSYFRSRRANDIVGWFNRYTEWRCRRCALGRCPRIPNYNLQKCHDSDPRFAQVTSLSLLSSLQSLKLRFWDEQAKELVGYAHIRKLEAGHRASQY